jgi:hypothetical protein
LTLENTWTRRRRRRRRTSTVRPCPNLIWLQCQRDFSTNSLGTMRDTPNMSEFDDTDQIVHWHFNRKTTAKCLMLE